MAVTAGGTLRLDQLEAEVRSHGIDPATLDYTRPLGAVSVYLSSQARMSFSRQATPDGTPWPPFKRTPSRRRGGRSAKLLWDRGILAASMSARAARGAVRDIQQSGALARLEHGSNLDYAGYQFLGTGTIPARTAVGITDEMAQRIEMLVADDVVRQMGFAPAP
jgi:phage gpG-like protein